MYRPKDVADNLSISPATLRLWSNHFAEVLSPAAQKAQTESGTPAQRRYTDGDLAIFKRAKQLLGDGKTYEDTLRLLQAEPQPEPIAAPEDTDDEEPIIPLPSSETALSPNLDEHPVFIAFREALAAKDEVIRTKDALITEKDAVIEKTNQVVTSKDDLIRAHEATIGELKAQNQALSVPWWKRLFSGN